MVRDDGLLWDDRGESLVVLARDEQVDRIGEWLQVLRGVPLCRCDFFFLCSRGSGIDRVRSGAREPCLRHEQQLMREYFLRCLRLVEEERGGVDTEVNDVGVLGVAGGDRVLEDSDRSVSVKWLAIS